MPYRTATPPIPRVDAGRCQAGQACATSCAARAVCPVKALVVMDPGEPPFVDGHLCHGCLVCRPACPFDAIVV